MENLVKSFINVALGGNNNNDDDNNNNNNNNSDSVIEERSRSTWAQVVSGEHDEGEDRRQGRNQNDQWSRLDHQSYGYHEGSRFVESRPSHRPQELVYGSHVKDEDCRNDDYGRNQKEEQDRNDDGWQTANRKHSKRPQKVHMDHWKRYKLPPSEQEYCNEVEYHSEMNPSEEDLRDFSKACSKLWELDFNRLTPGKDYEIDVGEGKRLYEKEDVAPGNLFIWLSEDVLKKPTFSRFCSLLDNYNPQEGHKEVVTAEEKQEQAAFIEEISRTTPIKYLHKYLSAKGRVSEDYSEFKRLMIDLWFRLYGRGGTSGSSSAFEHVFVGEIKQRGDQQVSGFHNWLQFYLEEAKERVDYQGYILPRRHGQFPDSETQLLTVQFEWNGVMKSLSSMFIGVSPEFEVALYTLCFFEGGEDNHIMVGPCPVNIKCYRLGNTIGSAFPIAEA